MNVQWETYFSQTFERLEKPLLAVRDAIAAWETNTQRRMKRLILVPHQFLHLLPLHALPLRDGERWGSRTAIQYAPSASVMWQLHQANARTESAPTRKAAEHRKIVIAFSPLPKRPTPLKKQKNHSSLLGMRRRRWPERSTQP